MQSPFDEECASLRRRRGDAAFHHGPAGLSQGKARLRRIQSADRNLPETKRRRLPLSAGGRPAHAGREGVRLARRPHLEPLFAGRRRRGNVDRVSANVRQPDAGPSVQRNVRPRFPPGIGRLARRPRNRRERAYVGGASHVRKAPVDSRLLFELHRGLPGIRSQRVRGRTLGRPRDDRFLLAGEPVLVLPNRLAPVVSITQGSVSDEKRSPNRRIAGSHRLARSVGEHDHPSMPTTARAEPSSSSSDRTCSDSAIRERSASARKTRSAAEP